MGVLRFRARRGSRRHAAPPLFFADLRQFRAGARGSRGMALFRGCAFCRSPPRSFLRARTALGARLCFCIPIRRATARIRRRAAQRIRLCGAARPRPCGVSSQAVLHRKCAGAGSRRSARRAGSAVLLAPRSRRRCSELLRRRNFSFSLQGALRRFRRGALRHKEDESLVSDADDALAFVVESRYRYV